MISLGSPKLSTNFPNPLFSFVLMGNSFYMTWLSISSPSASTDDDAGRIPARRPPDKIAIRSQLCRSSSSSEETITIVIAGTLLEVGRGDRTPESVEEILRGRDRTKAGFTAPAHGLFLWEVRY